MKYDHMRMPQVIFLAMLASMIWMFQPDNALSIDKGIVIGTAQWIDNLNPFTYKAYPAELIVQFTTERLIQQVCKGNENNAYRPIIHESPGRLSKAYDLLQSKFSLNLKSNTQINTLDIKFTLQQIENTIMNRYHDYEMKFVPDLIDIKKLKNTNFESAAKALTFPIIKKVIEDKKLIFTYKSPVNTNDHIEAYNKVTTGIYQLDSKQENQIRLSSRHQFQSAIPLTVNIEDELQQVFNNMANNNYHVALSVTGDLKNKIKNFGTYDLEATEYLNSFTYFGFNYKSKNTMVKKLFSQESEFRHAFAYAVASSKGFRECLHPDYFDNMNYTFDLTTSFDTKSSPNNYHLNSDYKIIRYIDALDDYQNTTLRLLFRPDLISFDDMKILILYLNKLFSSANINFQLKSAPAASIFNKHKSDNNFEIIFETFVYGQNKLRYIEFMNPGSPINFLGCELFEASEINTYMQDELQLNNFLMRINKELPVFVLGRFVMRNALSKSLQRTKSICKKSSTMPFTDIHLWKINSLQNGNSRERQ